MAIMFSYRAAVAAVSACTSAPRLHVDSTHLSAGQWRGADGLVECLDLSGRSGDQRRASVDDRLTAALAKTAALQTQQHRHEKELTHEVL